jgi:hypothetical protein
MLDQQDLFTIPDGMGNQIPCQINPDLYSDPALDIDIDDDDWVRLSRDEQVARLEAKNIVEQAAVDSCMDCPLMLQCREWGQRMGANVFGVVGGLTMEERSETTVAVSLLDPTERGPQGQVRDDLIERWVAAGISNRVIAERLGCNVRTVERRRAGLASGKTIRYGTAPQVELPTVSPAVLAASAASAAPVQAKDAAQATLQPQRVSPETAAVFDALMDGALRDRAEIVNLAIAHVDRSIALKTAPNGRAYADNDAKIAVGARKFIMNRIDIAVRRGRIQLVTTDNKVLICLSPETAAAWSAHRNVVAA